MLDGSNLGTLMALAGAGAATGVLAGLFGVGGGAIIVPILFEVFGGLGIEDDVAMPLAVGTSLAIIAPTSLRSARGHWRRGAGDMVVLRAWALPILLGVAAGAGVARYAEPWVFQSVFVVVAGLNAISLLFGKDTWRIGAVLPTGVALRAYGLLIGLLSALMGIGGGVLSTMVLTLHGRDIRQAVATSAGVGVLISIPGTVGYVLAGWERTGLPADALGFVSLLGFALVAPISLLTAQIGVNLAHALPKERVRVLFGLFLLAVCTRFALALATT